MRKSSLFVSPEFIPQKPGKNRTTKLDVNRNLQWFGVGDYHPMSGTWITTTPGPEYELRDISGDAALPVAKFVVDDRIEGGSHWQIRKLIEYAPQLFQSLVAMTKIALQSSDDIKDDNPGREEIFEAMRTISDVYDGLPYMLETFTFIEDGKRINQRASENAVKMNQKLARRKTGSKARMPTKAAVTLRKKGV